MVQYFDFNSIIFDPVLSLANNFNTFPARRASERTGTVINRSDVLAAIERSEPTERSRSSVSGYRDHESSDDGRPKSSRSGTRPGRRPTISLSDIEAARISAATRPPQAEYSGDDVYDKDMKEIEESHRRHRRTSSGSSAGKRKKRTPRSGTLTQMDDVQLALEQEEALRRKGTRPARSSEDYSSVDAYATIKRRGAKKSRSRSSSRDHAADIENEQYRMFSRSSITSEDEFLRLEAERSASRGSSRDHGYEDDPRSKTSTDQ